MTTTGIVLHPLDAALMETGQRSGLEFPPRGWEILQPWGIGGYVLQDRKGGGLRVIIDASQKDDNRFWVHVSVSRRWRTPSHEDMAVVKAAFLGDRYAYSVWPPQNVYVNIHAHCLHLWCLAEGDGRVLPEFSDELPGLGRSI